jgi:transposase InsO family protein
MSNLVTKHEAAEIAGVSPRTIERRMEPAAPGPVMRNGRPLPLYDVAAMTPYEQQQWARAQARKVIEFTPATGGGQLSLGLTAVAGPNLSEADRAQALERFNVIEPLLDASKYHLLHVQYPKARDLVNYLVAAHKTPARTIYRWLEAFKVSGLPGLVRKGRADKGTPRLMTDAARDLLLTLALPQRGSYGALRVAEMWRIYQEEREWRASHAGRVLGAFDQGKYARYLDEDNKLIPAAQLPEVSCETFRTWYNRIPEMVRDMGREGLEQFKNSQEIISHRDIAIVRPMDYVIMDHRRLDIFCMVRRPGGWALVRPWLTAAIDMRTRKWLGWCIVESPSSDSIATVLRRVFVDYGLPVALYWDNGKDFICEWFEGRSRKQRQAQPVGELDTAWRGVLGTLGIRVHHAIVRNARAKLIEPNFNRVSNFDRTLPEWCGHNPGARPERFEAMVKDHEAWIEGKGPGPVFRTIEDVARLYSKALHDTNERELEGDGMRKITATGRGWYAPNEIWDVLIPKVERRSVPADVLQMCFAKRKELTVQHGEISTTVDGQPYYYRMLDNPVGLMRFNGRKVELAYDPLDMSEGSVYFEGTFVGLVKCVALRRMGENAFVEDEKLRRASRREIKKAIGVAVSLAPVAGPEERLNRRAEVMPARESVARVEVPVELPAGVVDQAAAVEAEKAFEFAAAPAIEVTAAVEVEDEGEFSFFTAETPRR